MLAAHLRLTSGRDPAFAGVSAGDGELSGLTAPRLPRPAPQCADGTPGRPGDGRPGYTWASPGASLSADTQASAQIA